MLFVILICGLGGAWRSLVAHLLWEQGVGGSNPLAPTAKLAGPRTEPCGCSSKVEPQPSKLVMGVQFPSPALVKPITIQQANEKLKADRACREGNPSLHAYYVLSPPREPRPPCPPEGCRHRPV